MTSTASGGSNSETQWWLFICTISDKYSRRGCGQFEKVLRETDLSILESHPLYATVKCFWHIGKSVVVANGIGIEVDG